MDRFNALRPWPEQNHMSGPAQVVESSTAYPTPSSGSAALNLSSNSFPILRSRLHTNTRLSAIEFVRRTALALFRQIAVTYASLLQLRRPAYEARAPK
jgi:hypothetical protein